MRTDFVHCLLDFPSILPARKWECTEYTNEHHDTLLLDAIFCYWIYKRGCAFVVCIRCFLLLEMPGPTIQVLLLLLLLVLLLLHSASSSAEDFRFTPENEDGDVKISHFPDNFLFGTATSAYQACCFFSKKMGYFFSAYLHLFVFPFSFLNSLLGFW